MKEQFEKAVEAVKDLNPSAVTDERAVLAVLCIGDYIRACMRAEQHADEDEVEERLPRESAGFFSDAE